MKTRWLVLIAVLLSNVITAWIAGSLAVNSRVSESGPLATTGSRGGDHTQSAVSVTDTIRSPQVIETTNAANQPFGWRQVESNDYRQYIVNLRAIGCPEATIRDIVIADVTTLFATRARTLRGADTNRPAYWKPAAMGFSGVPDEARLAQQQQLAAEKRALLKELLGLEAPEKPDSLAGFNPFEDLVDFLPPEKQAAVMEAEQRLAARQGNGMSRGDLPALRQAYAQRDAELEQALTPEQKLEYDLRTSPTAQFLRMQTGGFEFGEPEFRAVFKLQKAFDDEFGLPRLRSTEPREVARRNAAQKVLDNQIESALGEERYRQLLAAMSQRQSIMHGPSH